MLYPKIVVKVGTSTLTHESGALNLGRMDHLVRTLSDLRNAGHAVILVTSAAISVGAERLRLPGRPTLLREKQAAAAAGQCALMHIYDKLAGEYGRAVAQILLTREDLETESRRDNLRDTFGALHEWGVLPIVNENDSVSPDEIESGNQKIFGDNDTLSAMVAALVGADLLVLLTDRDGLYTADPRHSPEARRIPLVREITPELFSSSGGAGTARGTGGMQTKLAAAAIALENGFDMVIAHGGRPETLFDIARGQVEGTLFTGKPA